MLIQCCGSGMPSPLPWAEPDSRLAISVRLFQTPMDGDTRRCHALATDQVFWLGMGAVARPTRFAFPVSQWLQGFNPLEPAHALTAAVQRRILTCFPSYNLVGRIP